MIYVAHRGNLYGPESNRENRMHYIRRALHAGFMVEVDLQRENGKWYTGHDEPLEEVPPEMLCSPSILWHAKTPEASQDILNDDFLRRFCHWFWHEEDRLTLTSRGWLLSHAEHAPVKGCIQVCNTADKPAEGVAGICSDFVGQLRK